MKQKTAINHHQTAVKAPAGLSAKVLSAIEKEQRFQAARRRLAGYGVVFCLSLISVVPLVLSVHASLVASGFFDYASLLATDWSAVLSLWQNFALVLLEALPIFTLTALTIAVLASLESFRLIVKDYKLMSA